MVAVEAAMTAEVAAAVAAMGAAAVGVAWAEEGVAALAATRAKMVEWVDVMVAEMRAAAVLEAARWAVVVEVATAAAMVRTKFPSGSVHWLSEMLR